VNLWQTVQVPNGGVRRRGGKRRREVMLEGQATLWATPSASLANDGEDPATWLARAETLKALKINGNGAGMPLAIQSGLWASPTTQDGHNLGAPSQEARNSPPLNAQAAQTEVWATPNSEGGTGYMSGSNRDTWRPTLEGQAQGQRAVLHQGRPASPSTLPDPLTGQPGSASSPSRRTSLPQLSPLFVEWLMRWPAGWSSREPIGLTAYECWAMAATRVVQQSLS
jgi:hypothetical protein